MTDILVHDALVVTVDEHDTVHESGTVVIDDDRITDVRPTTPDDRAADADRVIDGSDKLVMPGLVNAHAHLESSALRGIYSDLSYSELLVDMTVTCQNLAEGEIDYVAEAGVQLAALNFIRNGITTVCTMDIRPELGVPILGDAGLRALTGPLISDLFWDEPVDSQLDRAESFIEEHHGTYDGRIKATLCPHDDMTLTRDMWELVADTAKDNDVVVHTHLLEDNISNLNARANDGEDSLGLLDDVGLLNDRLLAAHFRAADEDDARRIADAGASVAHCPSIFAYWSPDTTCEWMPLPTLRECDATVALGLDDHYYHDNNDLFNEARQTRMMANHEWTANQITSPELVRMLTAEGAEALSMEDQIGSLEPGKKADVVVLDVDDPNFKPLTNVYSLISNAATGRDVETVIVDGNVLMYENDIEAMDEDAVYRAADEAVQRYTEETDWEITLTGSERPSTLSSVLDLPKRGPAHLVSRLAYQSIKENFSL